MMPIWVIALLWIAVFVLGYLVIGILHALIVPDKVLQLLDPRKPTTGDIKTLVAVWPLFWLFVLVELIIRSIRYIVFTIRNLPDAILAFRNKRRR